MELKSYLLAKLIIPLLDDNITREDVSPNSGFVGIYTEDINKPYLDNHIFLLYDSEVNTIEAMNRHKKFKLLDDIYKNCVTATYTNDSIENIKTARGQKNL